MSLGSLAAGTSEIIGDTAYVRLPYKPRSYFKPFHDRKERFACIVAHRRCGKTVACLNDLVKRAMTTHLEEARYAYVAPTYAQGKTAAWDYLISAVSPYFQFGAKVNQSELRVDLPNGSRIRVFGADNYLALLGMRVDGCVLDEYADFDPRAWTQVIRPALSDRKGFATFIGTPRGHNEFYKLYKRSCGDPEWYTASLKASDLVPLHGDTYAKEHGEQAAYDAGWLISTEIAKVKKDQTDEEYRQEYECDFEAATKGAYYGKQMAAAEKEGRLTNVPFDPSKQVLTAWDIGGDRDATAIWFVQIVGNQVCLIDYHEAIGADSAPYAKMVIEKPYSYSQHFVPHDAGPNRIGIDKSYKDFLTDAGLRNVTVLPVGIREHGINAVRLLLPRCVFDATKCDRGIEALRQYQTEWDEKNKVFKATPKHDWASHGADAFRYLAVGLDKHITSANFNRKITYPKGFY